MLNIAGGVVKNIFKPLEWSQLTPKHLRQSVMVASQMLITFICILTEFSVVLFKGLNMVDRIEKQAVAFLLVCVYLKQR